MDRVSNFYEWNVELGGPILRDKLWFFGAYRRAHYDKFVPNTFDLPGGVAPPAGLRQPVSSRAVACEQGESPEKMDNPILRLTWQASQRNKFAVYYDRALRLRAAAMTNNTDPATASVVWNTPIFATGSAKWTSTLSSSLLLETGVSFNRERYDNLYQHGHPRRAQHPGVVPERPQERPQHRLPVERLVGAAGQLPRPLHGVERRCPTSPARTT